MADETLRLIIEALDKNAEKTIKTIKDELGGVKDKTKEGSEGIGDFIEELTGISPASLTVGAALTAMGVAMKWSLDQAAESEVAQAKLEAVLTATGNAAGMSVGQLNDLANEVSRLSGLDDELVLNAEAVLLTFRNINQDVFPQTIKLAADMAAVMGMDLQSAVVMLGKAMNDPAQGMSALQRVGVSFTEQQKELAKSAQEAGDMLSAQGVILQELSVEFGGAAEMMGNTYTGSVNKLEVAFGNLGAAISKGALGPLAETITMFSEFIDANTDAVEAQNSHEDAARRVREELYKQGVMGKSVAADMRISGDEIERLVNEEIRWTQYGEAWERTLAQGTTTITEQTSAVQTYAEYLSGMEISYDKLLNSTIKIQDSTDKYHESQANINVQLADTQSKIDDLLARGYPETSDKVMDLREKQASLGDKLIEIKDKFSEQTQSMALDMLRQKLAMDGVFDQNDYQKYLDAAVAMGRMDEKSAELAKAQEVLAQKFADGRMSAADYKRVLDGLTSGRYTIEVAMSIIERGYAGMGGGYSYATGDLKYQQQGGQRDAGGEGEAGGMYIITPTAAPEGFIPNTSGTFVPNIDRYMGGGGGSVVMNVTIATPINLAGEDDVLRALTPLVEQIADRRR